MRNMPANVALTVNAEELNKAIRTALANLESITDTLQPQPAKPPEPTPEEIAQLRHDILERLRGELYVLEYDKHDYAEAEIKRGELRRVEKMEGKALVQYVYGEGGV